MKRITGIGGIFFKSKNPEATKRWYQLHLGMQMDAYGTNFEWRQADDPKKSGYTQWSVMTENTTHMLPGNADFMINYRVENLVELVETLKSEGVVVLDEIETFDYGKFVHILDPDGRKIELWEPVDEIYNQ